MNCYLSLRPKTANEGSTGNDTNWRADEQLSQRGQVHNQDERQPGHKKDNNPNR